MSPLQKRIDELLADPGFWAEWEQPMLPPRQPPVTLNEALASLPLPEPAPERTPRSSAPTGGWARTPRRVGAMELTPESFACTLAALGLVDPRVEFVPGEDPSGPVTARVTSPSFAGRDGAEVVEELWRALFAEPHFCPAGIGDLICLKPSGD